jgi:hypothetical protein
MPVVIVSAFIQIDSWDDWQRFGLDNRLPISSSIEHIKLPKAVQLPNIVLEQIWVSIWLKNGWLIDKGSVLEIGSEACDIGGGWRRLELLELLGG